MSMLPIVMAIAQLSMCALVYVLFRQELINEWRGLRARLSSSRPMHHNLTAKGHDA